MSVEATLLFPYEQEEFWKRIRAIIREELTRLEKERAAKQSYETPGLTYKPLYKMNEVCTIFSVSRPTIYEWIKHGKLKPYKVRSRLYFLWNDIQNLFGEKGNRIFY
jgi:excisionase family DNA binding protein